jgi:hypothetical protein
MKRDLYAEVSARIVADLEAGAPMEMFYADRALGTFGRCGTGWFWWNRHRGSSPDGPATGPFATRRIGMP